MAWNKGIKDHGACGENGFYMKTGYLAFNKTGRRNLRIPLEIEKTCNIEQNRSRITIQTSVQCLFESHLT